MNLTNDCIWDVDETGRSTNPTGSKPSTGAATSPHSSWPGSTSASGAGLPPFPLILDSRSVSFTDKERCSPRQKLRVGRLEANVEPLLN